MPERVLFCRPPSPSNIRSHRNKYSWSMLEIYKIQILCSLARFCNSWLGNSLLDKLLPPTFFWNQQNNCRIKSFGEIMFSFFILKNLQRLVFFLTWSLILVIIFFAFENAILTTTLIFLSKSWKLIWKNFMFFYVVQKLTWRSRKPTDHEADFLSFEDLHPLFHWQVSVGRCSAGNLEVSAYTGTATLRLVKTQGLPLGSNEEIWVYWFNSNTTEW